jgi:hypothetical protein
MFCTRCGANNLDTDQFCRSCSSPLARPGGAQGQGASSGSPQQPYPYSTPGPGQQQQPPQGYAPYPGYQAQPQYSYANQMSSRQNGASGRAIAAMILSIISIFTCGPLLSIPGMILGKSEMNAIRQGQAPPAGDTFAKVGFYLGLGVTILSCLGGLFYIFIVILGTTSGSFQ